MPGFLLARALMARVPSNWLSLWLSCALCAGTGTGPEVSPPPPACMESEEG